MDIFTLYICPEGTYRLLLYIQIEMKNMRTLLKAKINNKFLDNVILTAQITERRNITNIVIDLSVQSNFSVVNFNSILLEILNLNQNISAALLYYAPLIIIPYSFNLFILLTLNNSTVTKQQIKSGWVNYLFFIQVEKIIQCICQCKFIWIWIIRNDHYVV